MASSDRTKHDQTRGSKFASDSQVEEGGFELPVPDRARFAVGVIEIVKAGIGISLEDPGIASEMPVARV